MFDLFEKSVNNYSISLVSPAENRNKINGMESELFFAIFLLYWINENKNWKYLDLLTFSRLYLFHLMQHDFRPTPNQERTPHLRVQAILVSVSCLWHSKLLKENKKWSSIRLTINANRTVVRMFTF